MLETKGSRQKEGIEKKPSGHYNTKVFSFENVEKHETGDEKGDKKRKEREDTKQLELDGKWNKKNKNKRKEKNTKRTK